jgi:tRNA U55 pseudouridine synthase TruB
MTLSELKERAESGDMSFVQSVESIFAVYDELTVSDKQANRFVNGNPLDIARTSLKNSAEDKKIYRVKDKQGSFLSLGIVDGDSLKLYKHF